MKHWKRFLSVFICLLFMLSAIGASATFSDQDQIQNTEAVDVCVSLNIIGGYPDGFYRPDGKVTRAQMCKMICLLCNGGRDPALDTTPSTSFIDIQGWATPYIAACYAQDIVSGVSEDRFHPDGHVTAAQAAKMLLVTLGYSTDYEGFTGAAWSTNVTILATQAKLFDGLNLSPTQVLTRDEAAQMIWNALNAYEVTYTTQTVTDANGQESIKVVREEKVIAGTTDKLTLIKDKYSIDTPPTEKKTQP